MRRFLLFIFKGIAMRVNYWKIAVYCIVVIGIFALGIFTGRRTVRTEVEYIKGDPVTDTLFLPPPVEESRPVDTLGIIEQCIADGIYSDLWPERRDTLLCRDTIYVPTAADTSAILSDWATRRFYSDTLFNSEDSGYLDYCAEVQYNRLLNFSYCHIPVTKHVTEIKDGSKILSPFVGLGYSVNIGGDKNPMLLLNAGLFVKEKYGVYAMYQRGLVLNDDYIGGGIIYKF